LQELKILTEAPTPTAERQQRKSMLTRQRVAKQLTQHTAIKDFRQAEAVPAESIDHAIVHEGT
jgi:hypothetical protein